MTYMQAKLLRDLTAIIKAVAESKEAKKALNG